MVNKHKVSSDSSPSWLHILSFSVLVLFLFLPLAQESLKIFSPEPLAGVEQVQDSIPLTSATWWDGSFQQNFEQRQYEWMGLRPWMVRLRNQLTRRRVEWTDRAVEQLKEITARKGALEFFDTGETSQVRACIDDVLAVDVRSAFQTQKARAGKFQAERSKRISQQGTQPQPLEEWEEGQCTQQLDNLIISYDIREPTSNVLDAAAESGAEDHVIVHSIRML